MTSVKYYGAATAYYGPAPAYYGGSGTSSAVPFGFPVALAGRPYLVDLSQDWFRRGAEPRLRDTVDQSETPGEPTISLSGLWRRGQTSWHLGAGQQHNDDADPELDRFHRSRRTDCWHRNDLRLLRTVARIAESSTNLFMVSVGTAMYYSAGTAVKKITPPATSSTPFTAPAAVTGLATDGVRVFVAAGDSQIVEMVNDATATNTTIVTGASGVTVIGWALNRLLGAKTTGAVYDMTPNIGTPAALPAAQYTHQAGAQATWVGFAGGSTHIYGAVKVRSRSQVYKWTIKDDGTALDAPSPATPGLPDGEVITSIDSYGGLIFLGFEKGVRVAEPETTTGNLIIGALIPTNGSVTCFEGEGQFVWYGNPSIDATTSGLGRMDPTQILASSAPAYANDLEAFDVSDVDYVGAVQGVASITDATRTEDPSGAFSRRYFSISGQGVFYETDLCQRTGYIETGIFTYSLPDSKLALKLDVNTSRTSLTGQEVQVALDVDGAGYVDLGAHSLASVSSVIDTRQQAGTSFAAKLTLDAGADGLDIDDSPVLERWQLRAYPTPNRGRIFQVPLLLHSLVKDYNEVEYVYDVRDELDRLDDLWLNPRVVLFQVGTVTFEVIVEDIEFIHRQWHDDPETPGFEGTALATLKTLAE
jgi:hypothetical protein